MQEQRTKKELTREVRQRIVSRLLSELKDHGDEGRFARGTIPVVARDFHVCKQKIRRVWARALENFENPDTRQFRSSPQKHRCGRPKKWNHDDVREAVKLIPLFQRRTISNLAAALGIPKSTLFAMKCDKDDPVMMPCTSALEPALTAEHGLLRVSFCLTKIDPATRLYDDFYQSIHVDEMWFFNGERPATLHCSWLVCASKEVSK